jgi:Zn-dependent alcohol dehydrogenase
MITTTAALLAEYNQPLIVDEITLEPPRSGEVLLRMLSSGICRSDISLIDGYWPVPICQWCSDTRVQE